MTTPYSATDLGSLPLLHDLTPAQLERLRPLLRARTFANGVTLMSSEQPGEVAYLLLSGTLKVYVEQASGATVILAFLGPGEVVGELSLLDRGGRSATVVTMEETATLWIDRSAFADCLRTMPGIALNLVAILARRLRLANAQVQALATLDVYGRVARQLIALADAYGEPTGDGVTLIPLRLTQTDLADSVGASRVRVNQVLVAFKDNGLISVDNHYHMSIHKRDALTDYYA